MAGETIVPQPPSGEDGSGIYQELRGMEDRKEHAFAKKVEAAQLQAEIEAAKAAVAADKENSALGTSETEMKNELADAEARIQAVATEQREATDSVFAQRKATSLEVAALKRNLHTIRRRNQEIAMNLNITV